jgi:hypothetical protein
MAAAAAEPSHVPRGGLPYRPPAIRRRVAPLHAAAATSAAAAATASSYTAVPRIPSLLLSPGLGQLPLALALLPQSLGLPLCFPGSCHFAHLALQPAGHVGMALAARSAPPAELAPFPVGPEQQ